MNHQSQNGSLEISIHHKIATFTFQHPASNSFPSALLTELTAAFYTISKNEEVHLIVLKSEGNGAFCAGASFNELISISNLKEGTAFFAGFANVINAMRTCSKLIIGRVQGKAVGGGVGLIAACDYVFASETAAIKLSELTIGIGPFVIAPAVTRKIAVAAFSELSLAASEWKSAAWAKEKGLYAKTFHTIEELDEEIATFTKNLSAYNPGALQKMKAILWKETHHWDTLLLERAEISGKLALSEFTKSALEKFKK